MKRTKLMSRLMAVLMLSIMLVSCLAVSASADTTATTISGCSTSAAGDAGKICKKLQEIYGTSSEVKYSTTELGECPYSTSLTLDTGKVVTVYLSQKPSTGDIGVQMGDNGKLEIDGITSDNANNVKRCLCGKLIFDGEYHICESTIEKSVCEVGDNDPICQKVLKAFASDLDSYNQDVEYTSYKVLSYKYMATFQIDGEDYVFYFKQLPSENRQSTNHCEGKPYPDKSVCEKLYDVLGKDVYFSMKKSSFFQNEVDIKMDNGKSAIVYLTEQPTAEQIGVLKANLLSDIDSLSTINRSVVVVAVSAVIITVILVAALSFLIIKKTHKKNND